MPLTRLRHAAVNAYTQPLFCAAFTTTLHSHTLAMKVAISLQRHGAFASHLRAILFRCTDICF